MLKMISDEISFGKETLVLEVPGKMTDKYIIETDLGAGASGEVFRIKNRITEEYRACKKIPLPKTKEIQEILYQEIFILSKVDHPSIVKFFEIYGDNKNLYLVMEECKGGELCDKILNMINNNETYTEKQAAIIFKQLMSAVAYCHSQGICHCDLKAENILLATPDDYTNIKLIDFGLSQIFEKEKKSSLKTPVGTSYYMSPEVILGDYDEKCDIWSAGVILYILLSGEFPFYDRKDSVVYKKILDIDYSFPDTHWKDVSDDAKDLIKHMLCKEKERYTALQVLEHTWVKHCAPNSSKLKINIEAFKNYKETNKLKRVVVTYIASRLDDSDIEQLKQNFILMDKDNNGTLSLDEMKEAIKQLGKEKEFDVEALFSSIDTNKNGEINYTEFIAASLEKKMYLKEEKLVDAFLSLDVDRNGKLSRNEFKRVIKDNFDQKIFDKYFKELDLNGDGEIDYNEFLNMMTK